ncbi:hypothetical protein OIE66_25055 [Nonomuraea sp. NBC_01738]|uniref:hypothetical protein n=1 Tax=Nonomuraea sp. NBC_01738 TaxID=2976003 RepID=UPI002E14CD5C|nr:hypothetical protein OIE66_25055 [Nonomuraea sp. NBC_01738]
MIPEPVANPTMAAGGFLAITIDDSSMHHYRDISEMLRDPHGEEGIAVECFDSDGFRLVFELNGKGQPIVARRTAEEPDQDALTRRIGSVIGNGRARLEAAANDDLSSALHELDIFVNRTYPESFEALRWPPYGHPLPDDPDTGDWIHNCFTHGKCF